MDSNSDIIQQASCYGRGCEASLRKTHIICTAGPSTDSVEKLEALLDAGMSILRLNFSHGTHEYHGNMINQIREACVRKRKLCAIAIDLQGPKIRTGHVNPAGTELSVEAGTTITFTTDPQYRRDCTLEHLWVDYDKLPVSVHVGGIMYLEDGILGLRVTAVGDNFVRTVAMNSHRFADRKGVNLPGCIVHLPAATDKDKSDLRFAAEQKVDFVFVSFARRASHLREIREFLEMAHDEAHSNELKAEILSSRLGRNSLRGETVKRSVSREMMEAPALPGSGGADAPGAGHHHHGHEHHAHDAPVTAGSAGPACFVVPKTPHRIQLVAKIESQEGIDFFDEILKECDGVMIARGDLGVELPLEKVFSSQKLMTARCNEAGVPVICATQMLESMTTAPRPTRAEVSDVGNAVMDGSDCVMLSGETAKGKYPVETVGTMAAICVEAESVFDHGTLFDRLKKMVPLPMRSIEATSACAVSAARDQGAAMIILITENGATCRLVAKYRPPMPILAITHSGRIARQALLSRGVVPVLVDFQRVHGPQDLIDVGIKYGKRQGWLRKLDYVVAIYDSNIFDGTEEANVVRVIHVYD